MKKITFYLFCILSMQIMAQEEKLRVTFNVGNPLNFSLNKIKDISFVEDQKPLDIVGSEWFNEEIEKSGAYESFEFHKDGSVTYCPHYINDHSGSFSYNGSYNFEDYVLSMLFGFGSLNYPVTNHSETSFVITSGQDNSIYYKVQKVYNVKMTDEPITIGNEGDEIIFVDNDYISLENNKIRPIKGGGAGYALVKDSQLNTIVAYRINVEAENSYKDWTQYFKKTKDEIILDFGDPITTQESESMDIFYYFEKDPAFLIMSFAFDKVSGKMFMFQGTFTDDVNLNFYLDGLSREYIKDEERSSGSVLYYYDTDDLSTASVSIAIQNSPTKLVNYMDRNR